MLFRSNLNLKDIEIVENSNIKKKFINKMGGINSLSLTMNMCYEYNISEPVITCSYCNKEIPLTEAISHKMLEKLQKEF